MIPRSALWFLALLPCPLLGAEPPRLDRYGDPLPPRALARMGTAWLRVDQPIRAFAFWPDDRTLAACCEDGSLRFWERSTGRPIRRLQTPLDSVRAAVFVPGTKAVVLHDEERRILLWDTATTKTIWSFSLPDYDRNKNCLAVSPDGTLLAAPEKESKVGLYDAASGRKIHSLEDAGDNALVFSPDSKFLAIASNKSPLHLWDIRSRKKLSDLPSPKYFSDGPAIAFSSDGKRIAVGNGSNAVVSEVATAKELFRLQFHWGITQRGLLFAADGKSLITGHYPGEVHSWDAATGKEQFARKTHWHQSVWPALSRDGKVLAGGEYWGQYCLIRLLDPATGKDVGPAIDGHEFQVNFAAFSPDGKTLLSSDNETIREWNAETGKQGRQIRRHIFSDEAPVFSADRKLLAEISTHRVDVWEVGHDQSMRSLKHKGKDAIRALTFSADGKFLLSAHNHFSPDRGEGKIEGQDGLHFWDLATGKELRSSVTPTADLYSQLVITPDGRTAIAGSVKGRVSRQNNGSSTWSDSKAAGQLYMWDLPSCRQIRTLQGHGGAIRALALSGDGRLLASGSADHTIRLWELASGKTLFTLPIVKSYNPAVALSPDGRLLAVSSGYTVRLYSTSTGKPVLELGGQSSEVRCVAFSPDNRRLASGLRDGTALVWDISAACRAVRPETRRLNANELGSLWTNLADADALRAYRAIAELSGGGDAAVSMLKRRLHPAESVEPKRLARFVADLDADDFAVREDAMQQLAKLGQRAEAALSTALKNRPSLEARKRIEELLTRVQRREWSPEQLREQRALRVLERIASAEAREVLQSLAIGSADAWLTQEAKATQGRLDSHK